MKTLRDWGHWWIVTLSFVAFVALEGVFFYWLYRFLSHP